MNKFEYLIKQLGRIEQKKYEHYVITRIWHLLNDLEIKIITQQYIKREKGFALTDLYFPQLKTHVEIDEAYHKQERQVELDKIREKDIINTINHEIIRVDVNQEISEVNKKIDEIVRDIKKKKLETKNFIPWNIETEQTPDIYISKGYLDADEDILFKKSIQALKCFGVNYKRYQRGGKKHPYEENVLIWFPKTYQNKKWLNEISEDDIYIYEKARDLQERKKHIEKYLKSEEKTRIVFAQVRDSLGDIMYRFKGKYILDNELTNNENGLVWKRTDTKVNTYKLK